MDGNCIADATSLQSLVDLISKKAHGKSAGIVTYIEMKDRIGLGQSSKLEFRCDRSYQ